MSIREPPGHAIVLQGGQVNEPASSVEHPAEPTDAQPGYRRESHTPEKTERILRLLAEYTEKLRADCNEIQTRRTHSRVVLVTLPLVVLLLFSLGTALPLSPRYLPSFLIALLYCLTGFLLMLRYAWGERQRELQAQDRLEAIARRLEPLLAWAIEIHALAERDAIRQIELNLRIAEVRRYLQQVTPAALRDGEASP